MRLFSITVISLGILCGSAWIGFAQNKIKVTESFERMSKGHNNALCVDIPEASEKEVAKAWRRLMKDYESRVSDSHDEIFADKALIKSISNSIIKVYAVTSKIESGTHLNVFFDLGEDFISSSKHSDQYNIAERIVREFAVKIAKEAVEEQVKQEEKVLRKLENKQNGLEKDNDGYHKDIEHYKDLILKAEKDIEENLKTQETTKTSIESQKKVVVDVNTKLKSIE